MIPLPQPTKIVEQNQNHGVFVIEELYPGYGVTIGNSLRRVLLSSLEGAAITQVKIKGVSHEFSTLPGVQEDIVSILLNLKQMRFRLHGDEPQKAILKVKGEKEAKGSDFELPDPLELITKDLVLAHVTDKSAELEIEIQVERGIGYVSAEERKSERQEIGTITLDAIFTPIKRVSSKVENMRVGDQTDFNRVTLEIETDGSLDPETALWQAADLLLKQFEVVKSGVKETVEVGKDESKKESAAENSAKKPKSQKKSGKKKEKK